MIEIWNTQQKISPTLYLNDALPSLSIVVALQLATAFAAVFFAWRTVRNNFNRPQLLILGGLIQTFQYFYYCGYVDEVYINLEHSWNLHHFGRYSFSPTHMVDGTVELFYYAILAPFAWSHLSLIYACIGLGLLVTLLHTVLVWYFVRNMPPLVQLFVTLGFAWNPIFAEIQGAGFGNGLVSLLYFLGFIAVWESRWHLATACTVILPLIRPDAVVYSAFLIIAMILKQKRVPLRALAGTTISVVLFMSVVRLIYGHWVLTPILYKKTPLHEIIKGAAQQLIPLVYGLNDSYTLAICILMAVTCLSGFKSETPQVEPANRLLARTQSVLFLALYLFYVLTNRNFFAETRRYYLPFEYFGFILLITEWGLPWCKFKWRENSESTEPGLSFHARPYLVVTLLIVTVGSMNLAVNRWANRNNRFADRTITKVAWLMGREDAFSVIAKLSDDIFPSHWRVATTELQGYGFLMDREIDPLFGYANRRMALSKTLAKRGTKTDINYLKDSKPEVIWSGRHLPMSYPNDLISEKQVGLISGFQTDFGFNLTDIIEEYPFIFVTQVESDRGETVHTYFLVRAGLETEFRTALERKSFQKISQVDIDMKSIRNWSEKHPFSSQSP